jgi:hypothetical protein
VVTPGTARELSDRLGVTPGTASGVAVIVAVVVVGRVRTHPSDCVTGPMAWTVRRLHVRSPR